MDPVLFERLLSAGAEVVTVGLLMLAFLAIRKWNLKGDRARMIAGGIDLAYGAVNEMARKTANTIDDKAAVALKKLAEYVAAQGGEPLTAKEVSQARLTFDAKHGNESKLLEAVAAASPS